MENAFDTTDSPGGSIPVTPSTSSQEVVTTKPVQTTTVTTTSPVTPAPTSGFISSEFVATSISMIATIWGMIDGFIPAPTALMITAAAAAVYTIARTALKAAHTLGLAKSIPDLPDVITTK